MERFVVALHRRLCLLRFAERVGGGAAAGCAVAVLLVPILLWRGQDPWRVAWAAPALGGIAGACWAAARRPTALAAATEADRQLKLDELLATAWAIRGGDASGPADPWHRAVLALAAARAAECAPAAVLLHRFGIRAWGGIALALALVATLASFSSEPLRASASAREARAGTEQRHRAEAARPIVQIVPSQSEPQRRLEQNPAEDPVPGNSPVDADAGENGSEQPAGPETDPKASAEASSAGSGDGAGRTKPAQPSVPDGDRPSVSGHNGKRRAGPARAASGVGRAARAELHESVDGGGAGTLTEPEAGDQIPPWQHPAWGDAAESAAGEIRAGRVPDDVRDLVRAYFDRPAQPASTSPLGPQE